MAWPRCHGPACAPSGTSRANSRSGASHGSPQCPLRASSRSPRELHPEEHGRLADHREPPHRHRTTSSPSSEHGAPSGNRRGEQPDPAQAGPPSIPCSQTCSTASATTSGPPPRGAPEQLRSSRAPPPKFWTCPLRLRPRPRSTSRIPRSTRHRWRSSVGDATPRSSGVRPRRAPTRSRAPGESSPRCRSTARSPSPPGRLGCCPCRRRCRCR
mmetsp:Transcript_80382/g.230704  ORF Transcript_80382/g.230704 Transcript_80382/m.230704 type:complete len:213 (-) Transcript_80382:429-1067(-)